MAKKTLYQKLHAPWLVAMKKVHWFTGLVQSILDLDDLTLNSCTCSQLCTGML